ncbi:MAG: hypothetical protein HW387_981 [Parachlamydiales bacterium]|nr:hypothetical protein [Parachlamydiales bacterium]
MVITMKRKNHNGGFYWNNESYREFCVTYLLNNKISISGKHNYQFGIYSGITMRWIYEMFRYYRLPCERILAFDSFEGLPEEQKGIPRTSNHCKGAYNVKEIEQFRDDTPQQIIKKIQSTLPDNLIPIDWSIGFFDQVLTEIFLKTNPKPAFWVDLDIDLYISSIQVLDFMFKNRLIVPTTIVSFDDWGCTYEYRGGESLAWKEMCQKYAVTAREIHCYRYENEGSPDYVCHKVFIVNKIEC